MVRNMLKAISKMLEFKLEDSKLEFDVFKQRVFCAKVMLDEIIEGMRPPSELLETSVPPSRLMPPSPQPPKPKPSKDEVKIVVDGGRIVAVENATPDTKIELDGRVYSPNEVIGMTFVEGRVL